MVITYPGVVLVIGAFLFLLRGVGGGSMRGQPGFFDVEERLKRLSGLGDHLETFAAAVDFEIFRADQVSVSAIPTARKVEGSPSIR